MKASLRTEMRRRLKSLDAPVYLPVGIENPFLPSTTKTLFTFLSHGNEIETAHIIDFALDHGITVAAPRVSGRDMAFHRITSSSGPFASGAFGIREPDATLPCLYPDGEGMQSGFPLVILVPALAFSPRGDRLGRGAGYYDRFLSRFLTEYQNDRKRIILAGVCHSWQVVESVPVEAHDIPVEWILTEKGCILCV